MPGGAPPDASDPDASDPDASDPDLREILNAVELPPDGIRKWLAHDRAFCEAHGGARVYGELLSLFAECESALERRSPPKAPSPQSTPSPRSTP